MKIEDLKPAPYNPREISPEAMAGLQCSLHEFGDISGRMEVLRAKHGDALRQ